MAMEDATIVKYSSSTFVLRSVSNGEEHTLHGEMLVGREVECAIALRSGHISRYHAKLNVSNSGVYIEDLHSTNGTFVNGERIKGRVKLNIGDEVCFDDLRFRLTSSAAGDEAATQLTPKKHIPSPPQAKPAPARNSNIEQVKKTEEASSFGISSIPNIASSAPRAKSESPAKFGVSENDLDPPILGDRTQILSPIQLDRLVERNRSAQKDIATGTGPRLIVMTAPMRGKVFELHDATMGSSWQIGRDPQAEICINDKTISIDHARISKAQDGYILSATHAKNGILVNGQAKEKTFLSHNDKVQMGKTELVFKTDTPAQQNGKSDSSDPFASRVSSMRYALIAGGVALALLIVFLIAAL